MTIMDGFFFYMRFIYTKLATIEESFQKFYNASMFELFWHHGSKTLCHAGNSARNRTHLTRGAFW